MSMSQPHIMEEAESMLDVYIHDYLVKRNLNATATIFQAEAQVPPNAIAIDAPQGFLYEWWTIFWDTFIARYKCHDPVRNDPMNDSVTKRKFGKGSGLGAIKHHKQVSVPSREIPRSMGPSINSGVAGSSGPVTSLPLTGWPLMGLDQLHPALLQQQSPMHTSQLSFQHQLQQNLLLQARQSLATSSASDLDGREVQGCNNQNISIGRDSQFKNGALADSSNSSKNQTGRKRNQPPSSPGPVTSSRTPKTLESSPTSGPSTPSTHTTGDIVALPILLQTDCTSKPSYMTSVENQLVHSDHNVDDACLDDNIESLLSHAVASTDGDIGKGFTFLEFGSIVASSSDCCHLSSNGKLFASAGHDNKARLWDTDTFEFKYALGGHSNVITDIRFSPRTTQVATASLDRTVKVWDIANPSYSMQTFTGHTAPVLSVDVHPRKHDLICSSDEKGDIRYWSINKGVCLKVAKHGAKMVRFQPRLGKYVAAAVRNGLTLIDLETGQTCRHLLKGHTSKVESICWDFSGEYLASVSEDLVRVWKISSGEEQDCIHELSVVGKNFCCSVFHSQYPSLPLLIVGSSQSLDLWNMGENKMMTLCEEPITALTVSKSTGVVASAGQNNIVKLWK